MAQMYENPTVDEQQAMEEGKKFWKKVAIGFGAVGLVWIGYKFGFAAGTLHGYGCGLHDVLSMAKDLADQQ